MAPELIALMLGAALLHASWNAIIKGGSNKLFETALNALGGGCVVLALPWLPAPAPESLPFMLGSWAVHVFYYLGIATGYRHGDMSYIYTLMRGCAPLLTALSLAVLGAPLSTGGWVGVSLLCGGVLTLAADSLRRGGAEWCGTLAALGTAVVIMSYTLFDGYGARISGAPVSYACWLYVANALPLSLYMLIRRRREFSAYAARRWKYGLLGGLCSLGAYGAALWTMTRAPIALVAALRETSVIFGMLLAVCFLGEKFTLARGMAVLLVAGGTAYMRLFGG